MESQQHGGAEQCLFDLCNSLRADGYDVLLMCNGQREFIGRIRQNLHPSIPVRSVFFFSANGLVNRILHSRLPESAKLLMRAGLFGFRYLFYLPNTLLFLIHLRGSRGSVLHLMNGGYPAAFSCHSAALAGRLAGAKKILFSVLNTPFARQVPLLDRLLDALTSRSVDLFLPDAKYLGEELRSLRGLPPEKIQVVYTAPRRPDARIGKLDSAEFRRENGVAGGDYLICDVAVFELVKGHRELVEAFAQFSKAVPASKLVLLGDGKTKAGIEELCRQAGVSERVIFAGFCPQETVRQWLCASDLFVCPSIREGLPYSLIEAMFAGLPVVSTSVGGIPELVEHEKNGLLVPPGDAGALAGAMLRMHDDPKLAARLGDSGKLRMKEEFSIQHMVRRIEELYEL